MERTWLSQLWNSAGIILKGGIVVWNTKNNIDKPLVCMLCAVVSDCIKGIKGEGSR